MKHLSKEISFSLAKLLREKGVKINGTSVFNYEAITKENGMVYIPELDIEMKESDWTDDLCFPTIAQVIDWIYEKDGVWIDVRLDLNYEGHSFTWVYIGENVGSQFEKGYKTPSEAYEKAIEHYLTNVNK